MIVAQNGNYLEEKKEEIMWDWNSPSPRSGTVRNILAHIVSLGQQFREYSIVAAEANNKKRCETRSASKPFLALKPEMPEDLTGGEQNYHATKHWSLLSEGGRCWTSGNSNAANSLRFRTMLCALSFLLRPIVRERLLFTCHHKNEKKRRRMEAEPLLRQKLTLIDPEIAGMSSQMPAHPSH